MTRSVVLRTSVPGLAYNMYTVRTGVVTESNEGVSGAQTQTNQTLNSVGHRLYRTGSLQYWLQSVQVESRKV
jgi:hypothetical protein